MDSVSSLVKVSLPNYLRNLPIPQSLTGFFHLSASEWVSLIPFVGTVSFVIYASVKACAPPLLEFSRKTSHMINPNIRKDEKKVVDFLEVEDLASEKVSFCRCWKSEKFPYCDGAHREHNEETGDNIGPVVIKRKAK
ncbi:hypothetical protein NP493_113g03000 [Ridgeia piscesae]|uniref:CDGSH iron-sulfur domain-containing protein 2 homologue n=1 Tax=Ridgeia piscesae TaxID=27915 RepID=A0AAD9P6S2_RIDPI|nr:hypothetical protein NP493_113g03000 [Ridgeia piscesae]